MGLLDILNGMANGPRGQTQPEKGGMSPMTMAMLALIAYKAYQSMHAGSAGAVPADNRIPDGGAGNAADSGMPGGATAGGLGDLLRGGMGNLGGLLGGGAAGSVLAGGLGDLVNQLQRGGLGNAASSWVGTGTNHQVSPGELHNALGDDTVNSLAEQAGLSKVELLEGLSQHLPKIVDQLTPQGRIPTEQEMSRMI